MLRLRALVEQFSLPDTEMHQNLEDAQRIFPSLFASMQSFVRSSPNFRILTVNEQCSLFERNLHSVTSLYGLLALRESGFIDSLRCTEVWSKIYGFDLIEQTKRISKQLDVDSTIVKIMLLVIAFSSNGLVENKVGSSSNDGLSLTTLSLLTTQNIYVELLWKYMVHRYGLYQSVVRFAQFTKSILDMIIYLAANYADNPTHQHVVTECMKKSKMSLTVDRDDHLPLWGRKEK